MRAVWLTVGATCWLANVSVAEQRDVDLGTLSCALESPSAGAKSAAAPAADSQVRDAICTFKSKTGPEENYVATVEGVSLSADNTATVIWVVKGLADTKLVPGFLEQRFAVDQSIASDQSPPLLGETNNTIVLRSLADKPEGTASASEKPRPKGFVITGMQLRLKSAAG
jgi:hypothetical protein